MIRLNKKNTGYVNITNEETSNAISGIPVGTTDPINPQNGDQWITQSIIEKPLQAIFSGFIINSPADITTEMVLKVKASTGEIFTTNLIRE